ncbi:MAG: response regulator transcription factor [Steroidobacteraceae bacterium]
MSTRVRVMIVDDHPLYRQGLRQVIEAEPNFELIAEASRGEEALQLADSLRPALAILDVGLPDVTGLQVAEQIQSKGWPVAVVILTMLKDELAFNKAMSLGVQGYVLKENAVTEIIACMSAVAAGRPYISPSMSAFLLRRHERVGGLAENKPGLNDLTMAERRILKRIAEKKTSKEIATELFISPRTVETHRANICTKLALKGSNSLLQFALENRELLGDLQ